MNRAYLLAIVLGSIDSRITAERRHGPIVAAVAGLLAFTSPAWGEDCNGNGIADAMDIASGFSADCQDDGIPDECQLAVVEVPYRHDGGFGAQIGAVGTAIGPQQTIAWLAHHVVTEGNTIINGFEIVYGIIAEGHPVTLGVWSDPDADGDPTDAQLISFVETTVESPWVPATVISVPCPETDLGPPGTSFFIGAWASNVPVFPNGAPATYDPLATAGESWWIATPGPFDPNAVAADALEFGPLFVVIPGLQGDWYIRATYCQTGHCGEATDVNNNGVPDECDPDCNGNGVPDDYDIATGTSTDCNANGSPDECDGLSDCDSNGIADVCQMTSTGLVGQYFPNTSLSGPSAGRIDANVFFSFDNPASLPPGIPTDDFSVRWLGALVPTVSGSYTLGLIHDDGVRLFLDGATIISKWGPSGGDLETATVELTAGELVHVRLEYYEGSGGAICQFLWQGPGDLELAPVPTTVLRPMYDADEDGVPDICGADDCNGNFIPDLIDLVLGADTDCDGSGVPDSCELATGGDCDRDGVHDACEATVGHGLVGEYFLSYNAASGNPVGGRTTEHVGSRIDANIDFDWSSSDPGIGEIGNSYYTVRWTGLVTTPDASGTYTIQVQRDDGVRLWIGDALVMDLWADGSTTSSATVFLDGSTAYRFRMEYYNGIGGGVAILSWMPPGGSLEVIPTGAFTPGNDLDGNGVPDPCDQDLNFNGVADDVDIAIGSSVDCNGNGIPDECDVAVVPLTAPVLAYWRCEDPDSPGADSGPNGLIAALTNASTDSAVPNLEIPLTGAPNTASVRFAANGRMSVADPSGFVSLGLTPFTAEGWIHLDELGTASAAGRQWLFARKTNVASDAGLDWGFLAQAGDFPTSTNAGNRYGKTSGFSGREVALVFGFGSGATNNQKAVICSNLEASETGWHFMAVAWDAATRVVRFTLDSSTEEIMIDRVWFLSTLDAPLTIGAHPIASGGFDGYVKGAVDELRISEGVLPIDRLLSAFYLPASEDADGDGVPDECGPGCVADLDGSGNVDAADLAILLGDWDGTAADLDGNGTTDAADLGILLGAWGPCG